MQIIFLGFGRINQWGLQEFNKLQSVFKNDIKCYHLGEQTTENVSRIMQILNKAISCTPQQHIGKSGVFAAFKLHSVEVILSPGEIIPEYHNQLKQIYENLIQRPSYMWDVSFISDQFIKALGNKI